MHGSGARWRKHFYDFSNAYSPRTLQLEILLELHRWIVPCMISIQLRSSNIIQFWCKIPGPSKFTTSHWHADTDNRCCITLSSACADTTVETVYCMILHGAILQILTTKFTFSLSSSAHRPWNSRHRCIWIVLFNIDKITGSFVPEN